MCVTMWVIEPTSSKRDGNQVWGGGHHWTSAKLNYKYMMLNEPINGVFNHLPSRKGLGNLQSSKG